MEFLDRFQNSQLHFVCWVFVLHFTPHIRQGTGRYAVYFLFVYFRVHVIFMTQNGFPET